MTYNAYSRCSGTNVSHAEYDADAGIHGRLTEKPESLGASDSLAAAIEIAYAHLGRKPSDAVYIADDDDLIHEMIFNDGYHADQASNEKWLCSSIALLILCLTSFTASTFAGLGLSGFVAFCAVSLLYILITRTGVQNEVEGGVVCFIILVLLLLLLPALSAARDAYQRRNAADNNAVHTEHGLHVLTNGTSSLRAR